MSSRVRLAARLLFLAVAVLLLILGGISAWFRSWKMDRSADLASASQIVQTEAGPIELLTRGEGPAVLVLHGGAGGFDQGMLFAAGLDDAGFQILAPSRSGYLRTPLTAGRSPEEQADAMADLLDSLGLESAAVIGVSAGGPVAAHLAKKYPKKVWALVLLSAVTEKFAPKTESIDEVLRFPWLADIGAWSLWQTSLDKPRQVLPFVFRFENTLGPEQRAQLTEFIMEHSSQLEFVRELFGTLTPMSPRLPGLLNDLQNLREMPAFPYADLAVPSLVIHGSADREVSAAAAKAAAGAIPGATLLEVPDTGHFLQLGARAEDTRHSLVEFLRRYSGGQTQP